MLRCNKNERWILVNEIANERGSYKNFTGMIFWGENEAIVKNATFDLYDDGSIYYRCIKFMSGDWQNGYFWFGSWYGGIWESGTWRNGHWFKGVWKNGTWEHGTWFDGHWFGGRWRRGTWSSGLWENGTWESGIWKNGTWKDGTWEYGDWRGGVDSNGKLRLSNPNLWNK